MGWVVVVVSFVVLFAYCWDVTCRSISCGGILFVVVVG